MFTIKTGASRHVFLTSNYAIKIARVTPVHVFCVTVRYLWTRFKATDLSVGGLKDKNIPAIKQNLSGLARNFFDQCRHHIGLGIRANRAEARYWFETKDRKCVPTLGVYLGGLILLQPRGGEITQSQLFRSSARQFTDDPELARSEQWGWFKGKPRIVDYAHLGDPSVVFLA